jgi:hypothetical protein
MAQIFLNNASNTISADINASDTTVSLANATSFDDPGSDWYLGTLVEVTGGEETAWEIVKVTAKSGSDLTIERGQEGTLARSWTSGTLFAARLTAAPLNTVATAVQPGDLAEVATSGAYSDLSGTPTLGTAAATDSTAYATSTQGGKADTAVQPGDLADVATSGAYSDLSGTPTLGTAAATDSTAYATSTQGGKADTAVQPGDLAEVATSGAYSDLSGTPTLGTAAATDSTAYATSTQGGKADTAVQPGDLADVATSGAYSDLSGTPTLGTAAATDSTAYATSTQGGKADTAVQPGDLASGTITAATGNVDLTGTNGQVLTVDASGNIAPATPEPGGAAKLSDLSDVDESTDSASDGDILVYRTAGGDFVLEAKPAAGSNPAAADITDATADGIALITSADANPFTDADEAKLDGIEDGANVVSETGIPNNSVVRYDGTTGKAIQSSGIEIADEADNVIQVTATAPASDTIHFAANPGVNDTGFLFGKTTAAIHTSQGAYTAHFIGPTGGAYNHAAGFQAGESGAEITHFYNVAGAHLLRIDTTDDEELEIKGSDATSDVQQWYLTLGADPFMVFGGTAAQRVGSNELTIVGSGEFTTGLTVGGDTVLAAGDDASSLGSGAAADGHVLTADGVGGAAWEAISGGGTVMSVAVSGSDGIEVDSGSPITSSGTIALGINAATLRSTLNVEDGATADQTAQEIATAIDADATAETTLKSALGLGTAAYEASTAFEPADADIAKTDVAETWTASQRFSAGGSVDVVAEGTLGSAKTITFQVVRTQCSARVAARRSHSLAARMSPETFCTFRMRRMGRACLVRCDCYVRQNDQ